MPNNNKIIVRVCCLFALTAVTVNSKMMRRGQPNRPNCFVNVKIKCRDTPLSEQRLDFFKQP